MSRAGLLESRRSALLVALGLHAALLLIPVRSEETRQPLEFVEFALTEVPEELAPPPPEPEEPEALPPPPEVVEETPAPAGPKVDDPERDATKTSLESSRADDDTPDEEVPIVTGIPLTSEQLSEEGMGVRVGNTAAAGYDAEVGEPGELAGFAGGGQGGGGLAGSAGSGVDVAAEVLRAFEPIYPRELIGEDLEGRVVVRVQVKPNGRAGRIEVVHSDHPLFLASVKQAVRRYRFRPAELNGEKVTSTITLRYRFQLNDAR